MAKFEKAYKKLSVFEGGYSNHPEDNGGETFRGIARNFYPKWEGWRIIDAIKRTHPKTFKNIIENSSMLHNMVKEFYKEKYWNFFSGDEIKDQDVANEIFESSINCGKSTAVKFLQKSLNLLNRGGDLYEEIAVDGVFGSNTKKTLDKCIDNKDGRHLYNLLNISQGARYMNIGNKTFIRGWLKRIRIKKR